MLAIVVAVLAIIAPVAVYLAVNRGGTQPTPAPTATPAPSASAVPGSAAPTTTAGSRAVTANQLRNGTFDIPPWPDAAPIKAPTQHLTFVNGLTKRLPDGRYTAIGKVISVDVNHDGTNEAVAVILCAIQGGSLQVAAFTRDAAGRIVPLGQVMATVTTSGAAKDVDDIGAGADGTVRVRVGSDILCCGTERSEVQFQWRTYAWTGNGFEQIAGPTRFGPDPRYPDFAVAAGPVVLGGPDAQGLRHGDLALTVSNRGRLTADHLHLVIPLGGAPGTVPEGPAWQGFTHERSLWEGDVTAPAPGRTAVIRFGLSRPSAQTGGTVEVRAYPSAADGSLVHDGWMDDNLITVSVVVS